MNLDLEYMKFFAKNNYNSEDAKNNGKYQLII
jgi:hypothetical protein